MLHGVTTEKQENKQPLQDAQTNIACVLGTAPTFILKEENKTLNLPTPIRNYKDLATYAGVNLRNFTMYDAIETIFEESGGATVYAINVFDESKHKSTAEETEITPEASKIVVNKLIIPSTLSVKVEETAGKIDEDFEVKFDEDNTIITLLSTTFKSAEKVKISYDYADLSKVTSADFVGSVDEDGKRIGSKAIYNITQLYGDDVNMICAPTYSSVPETRDAIQNVADDLKASFFPDAPIGTTVNAAIQGRNNGEVNLRCTSRNGYMCVPHVKRYNQYLDETLLKPMSPVCVGMRIRMNKTHKNSIAKPIDNVVSKTIKGVEFPVEFILNKENTESNALNAVGLATVINYKGSYRLYGGRNLSYPSETGITTSQSVQQVINFIEKTIENSSFECVGENITKAYIDNIVELINNKFNTWSNPEKPIIYGGKCWFDANNNPVEDLANFKLVLNYEFCPLSHIETLIYRSTVNINIMKTALASE